MSYVLESDGTYKVFWQPALDIFSRERGFTKFRHSEKNYMEQVQDLDNGREEDGSQSICITVILSL